MDLALLVYAISTLEGIKIIIGISMMLCVVLCSGFLLYIGDQNGYKDSVNKNKTWGWRKLKIWGTIGIVSAFLFTLLPTQKTAYTMVAAYAAQKVSENDKVQQMSGKVMQIIEQQLDGFIDEGVAQAKKKLDKQ